MAGRVPDHPPDGNASIRRIDPTDSSKTSAIPPSVIAKLDDHLYTTLRDHFCKTGPGRPKALPNLMIVTNKIILQLYSLMKERGASWDDLLSWFHSLFQGTEKVVTRGRLKYAISKLITSLQTTSDAEQILNNVLKFDNDFPELLLCLGLTREILCQAPSEYNSDQMDMITNGILISLEQFRGKQGLPFSFVCNWVQRFLEISSPQLHLSYMQIKRKAEKVLKTAKCFLKSGKKDLYENYLSQPVTEDLPGTLTQIKKSDGKKSTQKKMNDDKSIKSTRFAQALRSEEELIVLKEKYKVLVQEKAEYIERHQSFESLNSELQKAKKENTKISASLEEIEKSKIYKKMEYLKKENEEQEISNQSLQQELYDLKMKHKNELLMKNNIISDLKATIKTEQTLKSKYSILLKEKSELLDCIEKEKESKEIHLREKKYNQFSDDVRLTVIALMGDANVAAQNCSKVIQIVSKQLFHKDFKIEELPSLSSILNFSSEAFHIANAHVVDNIKKCKHFTFSSDATSREKRHYLERHIVLDNKITLSLGFTEIARDDASTLLEKTLEILEELSEIYCHDYEVDEKEQVLKEIIRKMKGLMSDRAAVMKSYNKKMLQYKKELLGEEESIEFLYCNAHFLLGLVTATEKAIRDVEKDMDKLGRDADSVFFRFSHSSECSAFRAIRLAAEVFGPRGDEKSGCREEWLSFCSIKKTKSKFTSFRSNRFNNLFENAFALIEHSVDVVEFLSDYCTTSNLKLKSILADVQDCKLMSIVSAIALFFVNFTNPYWYLMNSFKSYSDFPDYVRKMKASLDEWIADSFVLSDITPVFVDFVECSRVTFSLPDHYFTDVTKSSFQALVKECKVVFERQLCDFLGDGVYSEDIDTEVKTILDSCPLTNLTGERLFGDFDYDLHKRRHASLHLRTTMNMLKRNKTVKWLQTQKLQRQKQLILNARRHSAILKKRSNEKEILVRKQIKEKILSNLEGKKKKEIEKMEMKATILNSVLSQGGLCSSKEDIDNILMNRDALVRLKDQIKFRKYVLGERISYTGNVKTLYARLLTHLGFESDNFPTLPQSKRRKLC